MAEDRVKSAREIALEKIARIADLSPEELAKQKHSEFGPRGEAIARKYLDGTIRGTDLQRELGKYHGDDGQIVRRAFISSLGKSVELLDAARSRKAMEGARLIAGEDVRFEELKKEYEQILAEFEQQTQQGSIVFETRERERLREIGVSGSAIRHNVKESAGWQQELSRIRQAHDVRLDKLRERLMQYAGAV